MEIISVLYLQQTLGTLLLTLQEQPCQADKTIQIVYDVFYMSNKTLNQSGRAGASFHMIRMKSAASDNGLNDLNHVQEKVLYLPLSHDGVFEPGLEQTLKVRNEQKDQLKGLVPEMLQQKPNRSAQKRRYTYKNDKYFKRPRLGESSGFLYRRRHGSEYATATVTKYPYSLARDHNGSCGSRSTFRPPPPRKFK